MLLNNHPDRFRNGTLPDKVILFSIRCQKLLRCQDKLFLLEGKFGMLPMCASELDLNSMPTCDSSRGRLLKEFTRTLFFELSESSILCRLWIKTLMGRFSQKFYLSSTTVELRGFELHWLIPHFCNH
jgi:hypothetical protein